jgi:hypothetical protein
MKVITNERLLRFKGLLFLLLAVLAAALLLARHRDLPTVLLLGLCVWASCRAYYFAFYVIERYIDPRFRFAGLWDCCRYLARTRRKASE